MDIYNKIEQSVLGLNSVDEKFRKELEEAKKYYEFYTGEKWGKPENYDLCINSSTLGIDKTVDIIEKFIKDAYQE